MSLQHQKALSELEAILKNLNTTAMGRRAFLGSMGLLLTACATLESDRNREGDNSGQETSLNLEDERRLTQEVLPQMRKDYPPLNSPQAQKYITALGNKIAQRSQLQGNPYNYSFTVVASDQVNAFALPAGTVFVTAPLITMAESEAELAGVIGHEIGHIKARHTAERMEKAKREQSKSWKYAVGGGLLGGLVGFGIGKLACPEKDDACLKRAAELGAATGAAGGLLVQKYGFMANSREDEMEADRVGFRTSVNAGYHKDHVGLFYAKLLRMEQQSKSSAPALLRSLSDAMSTHPPSQQRVDQMSEMAQQTSANANAVISSNEFSEIKTLIARTIKAG
jgi:predicted Zn-dependent protease